MSKPIIAWGVFVNGKFVRAEDKRKYVSKYIKQAEMLDRAYEEVGMRKYAIRKVEIREAPKRKKR